MRQTVVDMVKTKVDEHSPRSNGSEQSRLGSMAYRAQSDVWVTWYSSGYWNSSERNWWCPGSIHLIKSWETGTIVKECFVVRNSSECVSVDVCRYLQQTPTMEECFVVRYSSERVMVMVHRYLEQSQNCL